jgi:hypothetical protein
LELSPESRDGDHDADRDQDDYQRVLDKALSSLASPRSGGLSLGLEQEPRDQR